MGDANTHTHRKIKKIRPGIQKENGAHSETRAFQKKKRIANLLVFVPFIVVVLVRLIVDRRIRWSRWSRSRSRRTSAATGRLLYTSANRTAASGFVISHFLKHF
jgi:hypothetical protein